MKLYELNEQLERLLDIGDGRMVDEETVSCSTKKHLKLLKWNVKKKLTVACSSLRTARLMPK